MCEQCFLNPIYLGSPIPGFILGRARSANRAGKHQRDWFLVIQNDPEFYFTETPKLKETFKDDEDELKYFESQVKFTDQIKNQNIDPHVSYDIISFLVSKGFNPKEDGFFSFFLYDYLAEYITNTPIEKEDKNNRVAFEQHEARYPSDYTLGKE